MDNTATFPGATYRLQFNAEFTFASAAGITPYLRELGISDCYASPLFQAGPTSTHGYDVCGFDKINSRLGTEAEFHEFARRLRDNGLGLLVDMVPNHMGNDLSNPWWLDVLAKGEDSPYARWFDIDWEAGRTPGSKQGQVLLPVLEARYDEVLEAGKLQIVRQNGRFSLQYYDRRFPLNEASVQDLLESFHWRPGSTGYEQAVNSRLNAINGTPGEPDSFTHLDHIIRRQHYRLAYWRIAPEEINYRRFFDVTELISVRMELPEVFQSTHQLLLLMLRCGEVTGLRIDHPDGLWDPLQYFRRLRAAGAKYVVAEKILTGEERLPVDWPVEGTTGYDYLQCLNALFVDPRHETSFDRIYRDFAGIQPGTLRPMIAECKKLVLERSFRAEVNALTRSLRFITKQTRHGVDFTTPELRQAISDMAVAFPVYRTYINAGTREASPPDAAAIQEAADQARAGRSDPAAINFLESLLLLQIPADLPADNRDDVLHFILHFQQLTGPLMAKGLEDTTFYRYNRMISLNEVGSDPGKFGISAEEFHDHNQRVFESHPHTLLATATHDTKRGEDARARINVLSELPDAWNRALQRWHKLNEPLKTAGAPDGNDEYFIYQTLLGGWPHEQDLGVFPDRVTACILKSIREAKRHTSWTDPNAAYEQATEQFVRGILGQRAFLEPFREFHRLIAFHGFLNSLSQTLLKITSPGVPDFYQGTELWDLNLVDPDNRRPLDFTTRQALLDELRETSLQPIDCCKRLLQDWRTGQVKLFLTWRGLAFRNKYRDLFAAGNYVPLEVAGAKREHICAFARMRGEVAGITVVPRLTCTLTGKRETLPLGSVWEDTRLRLSPELASRTFENAITGEVIDGTAELPIQEVLRSFPVGVLGVK